MDETTNRLKLPLLIPNQSGKEFTHNEALVIVDNMLQNHVISKTLTTPPTELSTGDMYIVADLGTDDWHNKDNQLAIYDNGWRFIEPINGMLFYILEENCFYVYKNKWEKLEDFIDFTKLKNIKTNNLQENEILKYNGSNFVNTREIDLLKLYINNKLLLDENLNVSIKNGNDKLINIVSITANEIDFKNNLKIAGVIIDDYIANIINAEIKNSIASLSQNYIMPDYTSAISIVGQLTSGTYKAVRRGVICINCATNGGGTVDATIYINNIAVSKLAVGSSSLVPMLSGEFIVDKNDVMKVTTNKAGNLSLQLAIFCPFKTNI